MRAPHHPKRDQIQLTAVLYALSDPTRLDVVRTLARQKERACGTFDLDANKATLSHHFKVLRESGLTRTRIEGTYRYVSLRRDELDARFPGLLDAVLAAPPGRGG